MDNLPLNCISCILAFMSPKDVCRLAGVSSAFRSAADSNLLWETFLPADYREIISQSSSSFVSLFLNSLPAKALYFRLSDQPLLIGTRLSAFSSVYHAFVASTLTNLYKDRCQKLNSKNLVCSLSEFSNNWDFPPFIAYTFYKGFEVKPRSEQSKRLEIYVERAHRWIEIEIGKIYIKRDNDLIYFSIGDVEGELIVEGIEIIPISKKERQF